MHSILLQHFYYFTAHETSCTFSCGNVTLPFDIWYKLSLFSVWIDGLGLGLVPVNSGLGLGLGLASASLDLGLGLGLESYDLGFGLSLATAGLDYISARKVQEVQLYYCEAFSVSNMRCRVDLSFLLLNRLQAYAKYWIRQMTLFT